jgi:hypothetical protein
MNSPLPDELRHLQPAPLAGGLDPFRPGGSPHGRHTIMVDQWGPYDFRSPKLWPDPPGGGADRARVQRFRLLGPPGRWRLVSASGVEQVAPAAGELPGSLTIVLPANRSIDVGIVLEYVGEETVDVLGNRTAAGRPVQFGYG